MQCGFDFEDAARNRNKKFNIYPFQEKKNKLHSALWVVSTPRENKMGQLGQLAGEGDAEILGKKYSLRVMSSKLKLNKVR